MLKIGDCVRLKDENGSEGRIAEIGYKDYALVTAFTTGSWCSPQYWAVVGDLELLPILHELAAISEE